MATENCTPFGVRPLGWTGSGKVLTGRGGQGVFGLSKSVSLRRVHSDGSVHGPPIAHVHAVVGVTTPDFSLSFRRYKSPRMLIVVT